MSISQEIIAAIKGYQRENPVPQNRILFRIYHLQFYKTLDFFTKPLSHRLWFTHIRMVVAAAAAANFIIIYYIIRAKTINIEWKR